MKKMISLTLICAVFAVTLSTVAAAPTHMFDTPMQAAEGHKPTKTMTRHYQRDGYEMTNAIENAYRYFAAPEGDYDWGTVTFQMKSKPGDYSLEVTYVTITAYVRYIEADDAYTVSGFDVRENTVY